MLFRFTETVIPYKTAELISWKEGDKSLIPDGNDVPSIVYNQPNYHFGEYYVLKHFRDLGWSGFVDYAIGTWEPNNQKYAEGRRKVEELFGSDQLAEIRSLLNHSGGGEPDVFLFKETGQTNFLEVKKGSDRVSKEQLRCLALIKKIFRAEVGLVYLREAEQTYQPKVYELDLTDYSGRQVH